MEDEILSITTLRQLEKLLRDLRERKGRLLIFKHSSACPISARAYEEVRAFSREKPEDLKMAMVLVIEHRPVSNVIAHEFGVKHESPQVLLIEGDRVLWHTSHWDVTRDNLLKAVADRL